MKIDLNADLGEGYASDAELLTLVSSANIACGFHAGDAQTMQACVREAIKNGVAIGAHPSFPDRENFGRRAMQLPPETVYAQTLYQIGALAAITRAQGGVMCHVKPHGMLYNQASPANGQRSRRKRSACMAMASTHWRSPADYALHLPKRGLLSQHNPA